MYEMAGPIAPEQLEGLARELQDLMARSEHFCASDGRWRIHSDAVREACDAEDCARLMRKTGLLTVKNIGPFYSTPLPVKGQLVRLRGGAWVRSCHPSRPEGKAPRAQRVTVDHIHRGYVDRHNGEPRVINVQVNWAGAGGYWRWADLNDIEVLK